MTYIEPSDLWDVANDEGYGASRGTLEYAASPASAFAFGAEWGAGWMAAIIGMAEAIRDREPEETWQDRSVRLAGR